MYPQRLGVIYLNISTDGVYDTYKVWLWVCWEGQERLLRHITAACDQQTIILLNTNTEFKDDINYFYWVQPQNNTYNR